MRLFLAIIFLMFSVTGCEYLGFPTAPDRTTNIEISGDGDNEVTVTDDDVEVNQGDGDDGDASADIGCSTCGDSSTLTLYSIPSGSQLPSGHSCTLGVDCTTDPDDVLITG